MWLPSDVVAAVDRVALVRYVGVVETQRWNQHRKDGELRLLTGWMWMARRGGPYRQGFKTQTVAYRDCWYELVAKAAVPAVARLRVVHRQDVA